MENKIFIEKLTLIGFRKDYIVNFKKGLNFISGPLSTGKSSIVEMLDYALGKEKHKAYLEIRNSCSDVELEIKIGNEKLKIRRPLFDFKRPVKIFYWDENTENYKINFELFEIDVPSNPQSLSAFLLRKLGLANIKVVNQNLSFRDLFKYCYVKQTTIDSENLLYEKNWGSSIKRKPTFEIIFGIYNELVGELKNQIKLLNNEINLLSNNKEGIKAFLKDLNLFDKNYAIEKEYLELEINDKKSILNKLVSQGKTDNSISMNLELAIVNMKSRMENTKDKINEQQKYITNLYLLRNQYETDKQKLSFLIEGADILKGYSFEICPACLTEIGIDNHGCKLCSNEVNNENEEIEAFKSEYKRLNAKLNSLLNFIKTQEDKKEFLEREYNLLSSNLNGLEKELDLITKNYISPYVEQISKITYEIGMITEKVDQIDKDLKYINHFQYLDTVISEKVKEKELLESQVKELETNNLSKKQILSKVNSIFYSILSEFKFPKLNDAYIGERDYLPYVRGVKYDDLGSGGAVTMTTMAYFLALALIKIENKNHPGVLIIDSPRKNLGADSKIDDEFKDESIFQAIIQFFNTFSLNKDYDEIQLIVVNNGIPDGLKSSDLIKQFDGDGTGELPYGLIDDIDFK